MDLTEEQKKEVEDFILNKEYTASVNVNNVEYQVRAVRINGVDMCVTMDFNTMRVNVHVENNIVTAIANWS